MGHCARAGTTEHSTLVMQKNYKVVILGEGRVGQTSLLLRYVHNTFSDKQQPTIQAAYLDKKIPVGQNVACLAIWVCQSIGLLSNFSTLALAGHSWTRAIPCSWTNLLP